MSVRRAPAAEPANDVALGRMGGMIGYHLRRASGAIATNFNDAVGDMGMRQVLVGILSVVHANPGINQGNVGRALGIQRANMVSLVNEMVERGLVVRSVAADDRRAFALSLTDAGQAMHAECHARISANEERLLVDISDAERRTLIALLARIAARGG